MASGASVFDRVTRALHHPNYRLFFGGQTVSLAGTWITRIATSWLVYRLTGSELLLGLVSFCGQIPALLLTPVAGALVDRMDRRTLLLVAQWLSAVQSAVLAVLTLTNRITIPELIGLQLFQGVVNAFEMPARQSFIVEMVEDKRDLSNAIALNSMMVNGSRVIGPSIGGALIASVGEGWCFAVDAVSYLGVIWSLMAMRMAPSVRRSHEPALRQILDGWHYVRTSVPIRTCLTLVAISSVMGMPYMVLMPVMATEVLGGGPGTLGLLMTAVGVGALSAGIYLASRRSVRGLSGVILTGTILFGLGLAGFSVASRVEVAALMLAVAGVGFITQMASSNTVIQTIVEERFRGRVMGFYTMAIVGTIPIGSLLAGVLAERAGAPATIGLGGLACLGSAVWFAYRRPGLREHMRAIYLEQGIIGGDEMTGHDMRAETER
ncbi:MAG: MFS transporter [Vicinamibacterales bacterium]